MIGVVKTALTFAVLPIYGYISEAVVLAIYFLAAIGLNVRKGLAEISRQDAAP
jgi:hypothetical protein